MGEGSVWRWIRHLKLKGRGGDLRTEKERSGLHLRLSEDGEMSSRVLIFFGRRLLDRV